MSRYYWTHYFKCCYREYFDLRDSPPPECCEKFFQRELQALPNLEMIILLGDRLWKAMEHKLEAVESGTFKVARLSSNWKVQCVGVPIPSTGAEPEFSRLRSLLIKKFGFKDIGPDPLGSGDGVERALENRFREYALYEKASLREFWESTERRIRARPGEFNRWVGSGAGGNNGTKGAIDKYFKLVATIHMLERKAVIMACDAVVEEVARAFLAQFGELFEPEGQGGQATGARPRNKESEEPARKLLWRRVKNRLAETSRDATKMFEDHCEDLKWLRVVRNVIAHDGGIVRVPRPKNLRIPERMALEPSRAMVLTDDLCKKFVEIVEKLVDILYGASDS